MPNYKWGEYLDTYKDWEIRFNSKDHIYTAWNKKKDKRVQSHNLADLYERLEEGRY